MKTKSAKLLYFLSIVIISVSCVNVKNKKEIKEFSLKIIVTDKIQDVGKKLPLEMDSMFLPLEPAGCTKIAFLPKVEIIRYGFPAEYHEIINTEGNSWKTFFQKFYGNTGVETQKTNIRKSLDNYKISDSLAIDYMRNIVPVHAIENFLTTNAGSQPYIFKPEGNLAYYKTGNKEITVFKNINSLLFKIGTQLCEKHVAANQIIVVFYNPMLDGKTDSISVIKKDSVKNEVVTVKPVIKPQEKPKQNVKPQEGPITQSSPETSVPVVTQGKTITLPNGDKYVGEVKNGVPNGWGTITFSVSRKISDDDPKKTIAEAGDCFTGVWVDGKPQSGKLYDSKNNVKSTLIFGVAK